MEHYFETSLQYFIWWYYNRHVALTLASRLFYAIPHLKVSQLPTSIEYIDYHPYSTFLDLTFPYLIYPLYL